MACTTTSTTPGSGGGRRRAPGCRPATIGSPAPEPSRRATRWSRSVAGVSLVETIIALGISSIIIAGALSSFLLIGRNGVRSANYTLQANQAGSALEILAQDLRMASGIAWNSSTCITLTVPNSYPSTGNQVTYALDTNPSSADYQCFYQMPGGAADTNSRRILVRDLASFSFSRFDRLDAPTTSDASTKRVQVSMGTRRADATTAATSTPVVSASYIMRNKLAN